MRKVKKLGQSILEYIIVLTAIIGVIVLAANGAIRNAVQKTMNEAADTIGAASGNLP